MTVKHYKFYKTIIIIILLDLILTVSTDIFSQNQNDFRYVAYNDLLTTSSRYSDQNVTNFSRLYFDSNRNIIIAGARDFLFKFSLHLDLMQKIKWEASKNAIDTCLQKGQNEKNCKNYVMAIHQFKNEMLVCGSFAYSPNCTWRNIETLDLTRQEKSIGKSPFNPRSNITTLVTEDGKMFVGSTIDFSGADPVILRSDLSNDHSKTLRTKQYNDLELFDPQFVGSFEYSDYIYFVFREISIEASSFGFKAIYSRIARVCKNDNGGTHIFKDNWTSYLKARLNCSLSGGEFSFYFDEVQAISFLADEGELYAIFSTPENSIHGSAICIFNISSIENAFHGPIKYQETPGSSIWRQKEIENRNTFDCKFTQKSSSNLIDSTKYQLLERPVQPISKDPLYVAKLERFHHISVTKISTKLHENVKIIFISNEKGNIKKISILPRTKEACLIEVLETENTDIKIETMEYFKYTQSLYIGTENSLMKIPSQRCSRHISRVSCLNSMDPYCGWNDLTLSCTTAPNNDPLTKYWYQNSTMCPILNIPVDGAFSAWSSWFECAKNDHEIYSNDQMNNLDTCLCRTRKCDNPAPKHGGKSCEGHTIQVTNCTIHGGWSDWSSYGACSQTCGVAIKVRKRTCTNPAPRHNGRTCVGSNQQEIYCTDLPPCPQVIPAVIGQIDGQWSEWSDWTVCSAPCGKGFRIRERKCNNPAPLNNGLECIGCNVEYEECNKQPCNEVKKLGPWTQWLVMNSSEYGHMEKRYRYMCKAAINDPSELKISLFKEETRVCKKTDSVCQRVYMPAAKANWGCWTDFSPCSVTCGKGRRVRYRKCLAPNGDIVDDKECGDGPSVQDEICFNSSCDPSKSCGANEVHNCDGISEVKILSSSIGLHWVIILIILFTMFCCFVTFFITKSIIEKKVHRARSIGSPHYLTSFPNQYSSLPTKDYIENNKAKRQPSFSGSTSRSKIPNSHGTLTKSNNNLMNQNTPKILKFQNDTDTSTLKRNSALNNMRLKQLEDDKDKY